MFNLDFVSYSWWLYSLEVRRLAIKAAYIPPEERVYFLNHLEDFELGLRVMEAIRSLNVPVDGVAYFTPQEINLALHC